MHTCIHRYTMCICINANTHPHVYTQAFAQIDVCTHMNTCKYTCLHTHGHIRSALGNELLKGYLPWFKKKHLRGTCTYTQQHSKPSLPKSLFFKGMTDWPVFKYILLTKECPLTSPTYDFLYQFKDFCQERKIVLHITGAVWGSFCFLFLLYKKKSQNAFRILMYLC